MDDRPSGDDGDVTQPIVVVRVGFFFFLFS